MNRLISRIVGAFFAVAAIIAPSHAWANGSVTVLTNLVVTSSSIPSLPGWTIGSNNGSLSVQPTSPPPVSGDAPYALVAQYPSSGPSGIGGPWANFSVASLNTESLYIDFWAKMPDAKGGFKFCKIFGTRNNPVGYADITYQTDYTGADTGALLQIGFGDGTAQENDSQEVIRLGGGGVLGAAAPTAVILTPQMTDFPSSAWGTTWHHFRMYVKFNSGTTSANALPDGQIYLEIDGKVYLDASGLYNRNPQNGPIDYVGFFGWAQDDPQPFDIWYDNIVISTGGFASDPQPAQMSATLN